MKSLFVSALLVFCSACASPGQEPEPARLGEVNGIVSLDEKDSQLKEAFNASGDSAQLLLILSPT